MLRRMSLLTLFVLLVVSASLILTSCPETGEDPVSFPAGLVGTWYWTDSMNMETYTFELSGSGLFSSGIPGFVEDKPFNSTVSGSTITIIFIDGDLSPRVYQWSIEDDILTLEDLANESTKDYIRQTSS